MAFNLDEIINKKLDNTNQQTVSSIKSDIKKSIKKKSNETDISSKDTPKTLEKYMEVPRSAWSSLPSNTYIRYVNSNDGELKSGGRILEINNGDTNGEYVFKLVKYIGRTVIWYVSTKIISKIYRLKPEYLFEKNTKMSEKKGGTTDTSVANQQSTKNESAEVTTLTEIGNKILFNDNDVLSKRIDTIELRIEKIENNLQKIFNMVKTIYMVKK